MTIQPKFLFASCIVGCLTLGACGEGDESTSDDNDRARLLQALGLGEPAGSGDQLGGPPGSGNHLRQSSGAGNALGGPAGAGDHTGVAGADGVGQSGGGGSFCQDAVARLIECGAFEREEERENLSECQRAVGRSGGQIVAEFQRCLSLSCEGFVDCLRGD